MGNIHGTAIVHPSTDIHPSVRIGAYAVVGKNSVIEKNGTIMHHASIEGPTVIGCGTTVYPYAAIGGDPQVTENIGETNERSRLIVGRNCKIREFVTINRGTPKGNGVTVIGDDCLIMSSVHIAHDCCIGNNVNIASGSGLAGHVTLGNFVFVNADVGIAQFCEIGDFTMIAGKAAVRANVPPFVVAAGVEKASVRIVNAIGLQRNNFTASQIRDIKKCFTVFFRQGKPRKDGITEMNRLFAEVPHVKPFIEFIENHPIVCRYP